MQQLGIGAVNEFPLTLGRDFSGTVVATGQGVKKFKPGDEVTCYQKVQYYYYKKNQEMR